MILKCGYAAFTIRCSEEQVVRTPVSVRRQSERRQKEDRAKQRPLDGGHVAGVDLRGSLPGVLVLCEGGNRTPMAVNR